MTSNVLELPSTLPDHREPHGFEGRVVIFVMGNKTINAHGYRPQWFLYIKYKPVRMFDMRLNYFIGMHRNVYTQCQMNWVKYSRYLSGEICAKHEGELFKNAAGTFMAN